MGDWCKLNHVSGSRLYRWFAKFREEEPGALDGALYCFVSRDYEKIKILRFDVNG